MADRINRQIHLVSRPEGEASVSNFRLVEAPVGEPGEGQVLPIDGGVSAIIAA